MPTLENRALSVEGADVGSPEVADGLASTLSELTDASNQVARNSQECRDLATEQSENVSEAAMTADEEQTAKSNEIQTFPADLDRFVTR